MNKFGTTNHLNPHFERINENPKIAAQKVLSEVGWKDELPIDLLAICSMFDYEVRFESRPDLANLPGKVKYFGEGDFYIFINTNNTNNLIGFSNIDGIRRRQRFTLAHEIGHCTFSSHCDVGLQTALDDSSNPHQKSYSRIRENQANEFAAHLLIPENAFRRIERRVGWKSINVLLNEIVTAFDVSRQVAIQQMARLATFPAITILFKQDGMPLRVPVYSSDYEELKLYFGRDQIVPENTPAAYLLDGKYTDNIMSKNYQSLDPWFPDAYEWKKEKYGLKETSIKVGEHGVATFLEVVEQ